MSHPRLAAARIAARLIAVSLSAAALGGCTVEITGRPGPVDGESPVGGGSGPGAAEGKLSNNGLALSPEALALLEPAPIGRWDGAIAVADGAALADLAAHPTGLDHIEYLALCALDEASALEVEIGGETHRLPGLFGLAPGWVTAPCEGSCQRWVSACLLAHANAYGVSVTVSLRGDHPGLTWDEEIEAEFTLQEAAFYGNVFELAGTDLLDRPLYACSGRALIGDDTDETAVRSFDYLQQRICGAGSQCGLQNAGPCHFSIPAASACRADAGTRGFYGDCLGQLAELEPQPVYAEAITTYLVP